jgi:hypothetical protein
VGVPHEVRFQLQPSPTKAVSLVSGEGQTSTAEIKAGSLVLPLGHTPQYLTLGHDHLK